MITSGPYGWAGFGGATSRLGALPLGGAVGPTAAGLFLPGFPGGQSMPPALQGLGPRVFPGPGGDTPASPAGAPAEGDQEQINVTAQLDAAAGSTQLTGSPALAFDNPFTQLAGGFSDALPFLAAAGILALAVGVGERWNARAAGLLAGVTFLSILLVRPGGAAEVFGFLRDLPGRVKGLTGGSSAPTSFAGAGGFPLGASAVAGAPSAAALFPIAGYRGAINNSHWDGSRAVDIFAPAGTPIQAITSGRVAAAAYPQGGNTFTLFGDNGITYYGAHLQAPSASGRVTTGQIIGRIGNTGNAAQTDPHLHFAMGHGANAIDANGAGNLDPWGYLRRLLAQGGPP